MESERFDDLSKALARATSRRAALRYLGGAIAGTAFASLPVWHVLAKGSANHACKNYCDMLFGPRTSGAKQCIEDGKNGVGLCYTCGPESSTYGQYFVCCPQPPGGGHCLSYSTATCCVPGTCSDGVCYSPA